MATFSASLISSQDSSLLHFEHPSSTAGEEDPNQQFPFDQSHIKHAVPHLVSPAGAVPARQAFQGITESRAKLARDSLGNSAVAELLREANDAAQPSLEEQDNRAGAVLSYWLQDMHGSSFEYLNYFSDASAYNQQVMLESPTAATAVTAELPLATNGSYCSTEQDWDIIPQIFNSPATDATLAKGSYASEEHLETNSWLTLFTSSLDESDNSCESCPTRILGSPPSVANESDNLLNEGNFQAATNTAAFPPFALQCPHPSCISKTVFTRQCDLDKHYCSHVRLYHRRFPGCYHVDTNARVFATKKDRDRHERAHRPSIACVYCGRLFSRQDNLRDHCWRRHQDQV